MIAHQFTQAENGLVVAHVKSRTSVNQEFLIESKKFKNRSMAVAYLNEKRKTVLLEQLAKYIKLCENIMRHSDYPQAAKFRALPMAKECLKVCSNKYHPKTAQEIGITILMYKRKLRAILPHDLNKKHETALGNLTEIIETAQKVSGRKRVASF